MRVLVTGGAGFIGSHIAEALVRAGHQVGVLDDLSRGKKENVPHGAELHVASITSPDVEKLIESFKPQAVIHHAAQMDVRISVADPVRDAEINVVGTCRLANAAAKSGTDTFVLASTGGAIYGEQETFPATEQHRTWPESPYGLSKFCGEQYLDYFRRKTNLRTVCLRYANVYGPRQDPHGEAGVVAIFAEKMLRGQAPAIFGDGEQTRDYVFVGDVVRANLLALERKDKSGIFNIGTGVETSVKELARVIAVEAKFSGEVRHEPGKPGEQRRSVIDASRARAELGWSPETNLQTGLRKTVEWFAGRSNKKS